LVSHFTAESFTSPPRLSFFPPPKDDAFFFFRFLPPFSSSPLSRRCPPISISRFFFPLRRGALTSSISYVVVFSTSVSPYRFFPSHLSPSEIIAFLASGSSFFPNPVLASSPFFNGAASSRRSLSFFQKLFFSPGSPARGLLPSTASSPSPPGPSMKPFFSGDYFTPAFTTVPGPHIFWRSSLLFLRFAGPFFFFELVPGYALRAFTFFPNPLSNNPACEGSRLLVGSTVPIDNRRR